jgi:hypothetical protein
MSRPEGIHIKHHMSTDILNKRIKTLENDTKILRRLYFIKYPPACSGVSRRRLTNESSRQTTANTQRLWSFGKPTIYKNTDKMKAKAFGCYMLNGTSVIDFKEHATNEDVGEFLKKIGRRTPLIRSLSFVIILHPIGHITQFNMQKSMI